MSWGGAYAFSQTATSEPAEDPNDPIAKSEYDAVAALFYSIRSPIEPNRRREILSVLMPVLQQRRDTGVVVQVMTQALQSDSAALDPVLPQFARILDSARRSTLPLHESEPCCLLRLLVLTHTGTPELAVEIKQIWHDPNDENYAAPLAAAVLLTWDPANKALREWFEQRLRHLKVRFRATSASALGNMGKAAKWAAEDLRRLLTDPDPTVRVIAASALWKINGDSSAVLPTLRAALKESPTSIDLEPRALSAWAPTDVYVAVLYLGRMRAAASGASGDVAALLGSSDSYVRSAAVDALGAIGDARPEIIRALELAASDKDSSVAYGANASLKKLKSGVRNSPSKQE